MKNKPKVKSSIPAEISEAPSSVDIPQLQNANNVLLSYVNTYYVAQLQLDEVATPLLPIEGKKLSILTLWKYRKEIFQALEVLIRIVKDLREKIKVNRQDD